MILCVLHCVQCVSVYTSLSAYVCLCVCLSVLQLNPPQHSLSIAAARQSLINNVSFILKSGLTLAAFCLFPGARVRMYRLENKALKNPPLEGKDFPPLPPHHSFLIKSLMNHIFIAFLS